MDNKQAAKNIILSIFGPKGENMKNKIQAAKKLLDSGKKSGEVRATINNQRFDI